MITLCRGAATGTAHVAEDRLALLLARAGGFLEVVGQHAYEQLADAFELHVLGEAGGVQAGPE
jgi:hypothetical protein